MPSRSRSLSFVVVLVACCALLTGAIVPPGLTGLTAAADAQVDPLGDEPQEDPPGLGSIIGSPEAGPDPEDAGDRGGWAQLFLAVVVFGGVGFILTRVFRAASGPTA